jgi:hypothetical protein
MRRRAKPPAGAPESVLRASEAQGIGSVWTRAPLKTFWFDDGGHDNDLRVRGSWDDLRVRGNNHNEL